VYYKGVNYLKQKREETCVSVAIINALKWAGSKSVSDKHVKSVHRLIWKNKTYTQISNIRNVLKKCTKYFSAVYKKHPTVEELLSHLEKENTALLFSYFFRHHNDEIEEGHCILVLKHSPNKLVLVNESLQKPVKIITLKTFKSKYMKKTECYPDAFLLEKV